MPVNCSPELLEESTTFAYYQLPQQRNWISNLYKEESSLRSKITKFIKRTVLFSLLCFYNSQLIQHYTHIISQKTSCFKCKLTLKQAFSDWKNSFSVYFCTVKLRSSGRHKTRRLIPYYLQVLLFAS